MKDNTIYFIIISISLLIFSCETDTDLGYNILPKDDILNLNIIDTTSVEVYTMQIDSIASDSVNSLLLGEYNDPIFGYSKASFVCQFGIIESPSFSTGTVIDSAVLYLVPDTIFLNHYGNFNTTHEISVYELANNLNDTLTYYNNHNPDDFTTGNLIAQTLYEPQADDTLIAINLSYTFAEKFKDLADNIENDDFKDFFKGIYIKSECAGDDGAILKFKLNTESLIKFYSHSDDTEYTFKVSADLSSNIRFNLFEHDYSSTSFYSNIGNETNQDTVAYIQSMGGLKTKIKLPYIDKLKDLGNIAINRAELVIHTAPSLLTYENDYPANEAMVLVGLTDDSDYYLLLEYISGTGYKAVPYNDEDRVYKFDIAGYVRNILDGTVENNGLILFAGMGSSDMKRSVITTGNNSNRMKLVISYTQL